nr:reverse transcriptase domain-containing protein [Tanacetum cinerariifolium]
MSGVRSMARDIIQHNERFETLVEPIRLTFGGEEVVMARTDDGYIDNWTGLQEKFVERFTLRRKCCKDLTEDVPEVMQISAFMSNSKCPELARRFFDQVPKRVTEMMKRRKITVNNNDKGKVINMVWERGDSQKRKSWHGQKENWMNTPITFPLVPSDDVSDDHLIIEAEVKGSPNSNPDRVGSLFREQLIPIGKVELEVTFGSDGLCRKTMMKFTMVLVDFLNEIPVSTKHLEICDLTGEEAKLEEWTLYIDGASSLKGVGLRIARKMKVRVLKMKVDSRLVACQLNDEFVASSKGMKNYLTKAKERFNEAQNEEEMHLNMDLIQERRETAAIRKAKYKKDVEQYYNKRVRPVSFRVEDFVYRRNAASRVETQGKLGPN